MNQMKKIVSDEQNDGAPGTSEHSIIILGHQYWGV
jgi:hypothetical protein